MRWLIGLKGLLIGFGLALASAPSLALAEDGGAGSRMSAVLLTDGFDGTAVGVATMTLTPLSGPVGEEFKPQIQTKTQAGRRARRRDTGER